MRLTRSSATSAWQETQRPRLSVLGMVNPLTGNKPSFLPYFLHILRLVCFLAVLAADLGANGC